MVMNSHQKWLLGLYVSGDTEKNRKSISTVRQICDAHLKGKYEIEIIDVMETPQKAFTDNIIATPSLLRKLPVPLRKIIGDLTDREKVLKGLEIGV